jgi:exocyst complex protein 7
MLFQSSRKEANEYLAAVDGLRHLMENLVVTHSSSAKLVRAQRLMEMSMARLRRSFTEFCRPTSSRPWRLTTATRATASSDDGSTDEDGSSSGRRRSRNSNADEICEIDMMPLEAVLDLRSIAKRMVAGGYGSECVRIYGLTRKSVIEGCLNRIGVERLSTSDVQKMEWGILDIKIKNWIRAVRIAVRILFASEKRLCDEIFAGLNNVRDFCFAEVVKGPTTKLLAFGESVAMSKKSSERLFRVLDMYETLSGPNARHRHRLLPGIVCEREDASVYDPRSARGVGTGDFDGIRECNPGREFKDPGPGGTIHPLTRYVMNYLSFLSDYKETLMNITPMHPLISPRPA